MIPLPISSENPPVDFESSSKEKELKELSSVNPNCSLSDNNAYILT
jgi:hypothetical protein